MKVYGKEIKEKIVVEKILITITKRHDSIIASMKLPLIHLPYQ